MKTDIRPLTPEDLDTASSLMDRAWAKDYGTKGYVRYSKKELVRQFSQGGAWTGAFTDGGLTGLIASFPRTYSVGKKRFKAAVPMYLSVDPASRGKGIATMLVKEDRRLNEKKGIKVLLAFFDDLGFGRSVYRSCFPGLKLLKREKSLGKVLDPKAFSKKVGYGFHASQLLRGKLKMGILTGPRREGIIGRGMENPLWKVPEFVPGCAQISPGDAENIIDLAAVHVGLDRIWTEDELSSELLDPASVTGASWTTDGLASVMHFKLRTFVNREPVKVAWLDWSYGRKNLARALMFTLGLAKRKGAILAVAPRTGAFSPVPFVRSGFIPYPRRFELYAIGDVGTKKRLKGVRV